MTAKNKIYTTCDPMQSQNSRKNHTKHGVNMLYHEQSAKYHAEQVLHELDKIERFVRNAKKALNVIFANNPENENPSTIILSSINTKNNGEEKNGKEQNKQNKRNEENKQYLQIVQNLYSSYFASLPDIEYQRLTSSKYVMDGADVYRQLLKQGYTKQNIEQAIFSARRDSFWSNQFRTMRKLLRKNKDGVLYMDVFLALNQASHKLSVPKIIR